MKNILLITVYLKDYDSWKRGDLLLNMSTGVLIDIPTGMQLRERLVKRTQNWYSDFRFCAIPNSWNELSNKEKCRGALTYEEFKYLTEHVDKKILNDVVSIVVKY